MRATWMTPMIAGLLVLGLAPGLAARDPVPWINSGCNFRKKLTVDHTKITAALTNFPVLLAVTDASLRDRARSDGSDIIVTESNGVTACAREIERYVSSNGTLALWFNAPLLSSAASNVFYLYYNGASESNQTATWDSHYAMVHHLNEPSGAYYDSTSNGYHGAVSNNVIRGAPGIVAGAAEWPAIAAGTDNFVTMGDVLSIQTNNLTIETWVQTTNAAQMGVVVKKKAGNVVPEYSFYLLNGDPWCELANDLVRQQASYTTSNYHNGVWHHFAVVLDRTNKANFYIDGVLRGAGGDISPLNGSNIVGTAELRLGGRHGNLDDSWEYNGRLDEVRISRAVRSLAWIKASYTNQVNPAGFVTLGDEQERLYPGTIIRMR